MWTFPTAALFAIVGSCLCRSSIMTPYSNVSTEPVSPQDRQWLERHIHQYKGDYPPGFHFLFVGRDGHIVKATDKPPGLWVRVVGSPLTPESALYTAALTVSKLIRHVPEHVFNAVTLDPSGVGVFTSSERVTVFPVMAGAADTPACHGRCDGTCRFTCLSDGRKISSLPGITLVMSLVVVDNLMCTGSDPYRHGDNILVHEFAHLVRKMGFGFGENKQLDELYHNAKSLGLWRPGSYAMSNVGDYFAEATGAYFMVDRRESSGGMTQCSYGICRDEMDARRNLMNRDPQMYQFLVNLWSGGDAHLPGELTICPSNLDQQ